MSSSPPKLAQVLNLDDYRRKVYVALHCTFCQRDHAARVPERVLTDKTSYVECPGCDEIASIPETRKPVLMQM